MTDTIVEKYNGTITAGNYSSNQQTLFTTDASTSFVIKDISIGANSYNTNPSLVVNGVPINTLSGNLTGTALIGPSSTVKIQNNQTAMALASFGAANPGGNSWLQNFTPAYGGFPSVSGTFTGTPTTYPSALTNTSLVVACWYINGDFYYYDFDGNSTTQFYKRTGGPNGSQTTIYNDSYAPLCFDGVSKFYWVNSSGQLYRYDTATGTATYLNSFSPGTTYPTIAYCNGYIFYQAGYSGYSMYVITASSGSVVGSVNLNSSYSSNTALLVMNVPGTGTYNLYHMSVNNYASSMTRNQLIVGSGVTQGSQSNNAGVSFYANSAFANVQNGGYVAAFGSTTNPSAIYVLDSALQVIGTATAPVNFSSNYSGYYGMGALVTSPTSAQLNTYGPQIQLRITGVQSA